MKKTSENEQIVVFIENEHGIAVGWTQKGTLVRCKDCKYLIEHHYEEDGEKPYVKYTCRWSGNYQRHLSDYCSYGERRENAD